jgi:RHS repeat-associated protein
VHEVSGPASLDARFPGQWFMAETGLAYNWHRWYAAGLGRYTQPDPLGLEAGANRYIYANASPLMYVDPDGRQSTPLPGISPIPGMLPPIAVPGTPENDAWTDWAMGKLRGLAHMCFGSDEDDEDRRCREVIKECKRMCNDQPVDMLPGYGRDLFPRWRLCVRYCAEDEGCSY